MNLAFSENILGYFYVILRFQWNISLNRKVGIMDTILENIQNIN